MADKLINHIIEDFVSLNQKVLAIENNDRFLFRVDVIDALKAQGFVVVFGSQLEQRIAFELRDSNKILILLNEQKRDFMPDMMMQLHVYEFEITNYLNAYHIPTIISLDFAILDELYAADPVSIYSKSETELRVGRIKQKINELQKNSFDLNSVVNTLSLELFNIRTDWQKVISILSNALNKVIGTHQYEELSNLIDQSNIAFQEHLQNSYKTLLNSSSVKSPPIVSRILDYLDFNYSKEKIALIVIDGLAYWQYLLLKSELQLPTEDHITYSWLPSITQLSRQAIFRGGYPEKFYRQNPANERKLWEQYWKDKGVSEGCILYEYDHYHSTMLTGIEKYALVFKDLDTKMHSSTDYKDLKSLTEHWINRSGIIQAIENIKEQGFQIFITSDHGNVEAKGFLRLKERDKLGTNKSGSRSERHLEYSEEWLAEEFLNNNPEVENEISREKNTLYLKNDKSFSNKPMLVSHGGSHLFEVLIPFIKI
jgi:hypothetical protein